MRRTLKIACGISIGAALLTAHAPSHSQTSQIIAEGRTRASNLVAQPQKESRSVEGAANAQNANDTAREVREQRDLVAQEEMARWARWMFWAACMSVALSAFGVALIYVTFKETRRAADAADDMVREAGLTTAAAIASAESSRLAAQTGRAWLMPRPPGYGPFQNGHIDGHPVQNGLAFLPQMKNAGQSPALGVTMFRDYRIVLADEPEPVLTFTGGNLADAGICGPATEFHGNYVVLNDLEAAAFRAMRTVVYIYIWCSYRDIFSEVPRITEFTFRAKHLGGSERAAGGQIVEAIEFQTCGRQIAT